MKYQPPIGSADPNAPYVDDNPAAGQEGSAVPAKAVEHPQREIQTVIVAAGMTPDENNVGQLNEAIDQKISLATGGGPSPVDDLLALLRARLQIFPEIRNAGGIFSLSQPTGSSVRIPAGIEILHRGVFPITTAQQDFSHVANKTYHLRYRFTGTPGWSLVDVADTGYNPGGALPEGNVAFDSSYDDMITHRVVTDAGNVATITPLVNLPVLSRQQIITGTNTRNGGGNGASHDIVDTFNWSRKPNTFSLAPMQWGMANSTVPPFDFLIGIQTAGVPVSAAFNIDRYGMRQSVMCDYSNAIVMQFTARA